MQYKQEKIFARGDELYFKKVDELQNYKNLSLFITNRYYV